MSLNSNYNYTRVAGHDEKDPPGQEKSFKRFSSNLILIVLCLSAGVIGFFVAEAGSKLSREAPRDLQLRTLDHTFNYNRSFSYAPSNHTNRSWREMFPLEGGFFIDPTIAPTRSTFSVFHQLHCLDNMRRAYWANHDAAVKGQKLTDEEIHVDIGPSHVRHCTDLLRQSLMCHADTTIEVVDEEINGVHGFRTEHQCKDWDQLVQWTTKQQRRQHVEQIVKG